MTQEKDFVAGEGDAWYQRTLEKEAFEPSLNAKELALIGSLPSRVIDAADKSGVLFAEVGCSRGDSLARIQKETEFTCTGIDPSKLAIQHGNHLFSPQVGLQVGTATDTRLGASSVDVLFYGWSLTYVDTRSFPRVLEEMDRVLKPDGVLAIFDFEFFGGKDHLTPYKHLEGLHCYRRNYTKIFLQRGFGLISKTPFVAGGKVIGFSADPHERLSLQLLLRSVGN